MFSQHKSDGKAERPVITTYDSGFEHSLEHLSYVQKLVEEAAAEDLRDLRAHPVGFAA